MYNTQIDGVIPFHFGADPVEVTVNRRVSAPGVEPHRLAACLLADALPVLVGVGESRGQQQCGEPN